MKRIKKLLAISLVIAMIFGITANAAEIEYDDVNKDTTEGSAEVTYDGSKDQWFSITIPKKIDLGSEKHATYTVTVKGDVAEGSYITVEPEGWDSSTKKTTFTMTSDKSGGTKDVTVEQGSNLWEYSNITETGTSEDGDIDGSNLTLGKWTGTLKFLINFEDEYAEEQWPHIGEKDDLHFWNYMLDETTGTIKFLGMNNYGPDDEPDELFVYSSYRLNNKIYSTRLIPPLSGMFRGNEKKITFDKYLYTDNITDMSNMFANCSELEVVNLNGINTSNVETMLGMFSGCCKLKSINFGNIDTSKVKTMYQMFMNCPELNELDLRSFETSQVLDMGGMFLGCESLTSIYVTNKWNIDDDNIGKDMMFERCGTDHVTYID